MNRIVYERHINNWWYELVWQSHYRIWGGKRVQEPYVWEVFACVRELILGVVYVKGDHTCRDCMCAHVYGMSA